MKHKHCFAEEIRTKQILNKCLNHIDKTGCHHFYATTTGTMTVSVTIITIMPL